MTYSVEDCVREEQAFYSCPVNSCKTSYTNLLLVVQHLMSRHITPQEGASVHSKAVIPAEEAFDQVDEAEQDHSARKPKQSPAGLARCGKCGKDFANKWCLKRHVMTKHDTWSMPHQQQNPQEDSKLQTTVACEACSKVFSSKANLDKHVKVAHETNNIDQATAAENAPLEHEEVADEIVPEELHTARKEPIKGWKCRFCPATLPDRDSLRAHVDVEHVNDPSLYRGPEKEERDNQSLVHSSVTDPGQLHCSICEQPFAGLAELRDHVKADHRDRLKCPRCHSVASSYASLRKHKKKCTIAKE